VQAGYARHAFCIVAGPYQTVLFQAFKNVLRQRLASFAAILFT
jgi:hypothetical protein